MKGIASAICPNCKYCLGMTPQGMYSCGKANDGSELNIGIDVVLNCANFEWKDGKVEGKAGDICPKCKNCKGIIQEYNGKTASIRLTGVECEDPYDGMVKTLAADSDVCCSMLEMKPEKSCDKISLLQHELEMDKLRRKIHELEKEKAAHMKGIERLKKSQEKLQVKLNDADKENTRLCNENTELRNKIVDLMKFEDGNNDILRKALDDIAEAVGQPNNTRYLDDKLLVDKVVSAVKHKNEESYKREEELNTHYRYDEDIIKDIQDIIDPEGNSIWSHSEIAYEIKNLKKMVERRDRWVKELQSEVYTLQNEVLRIRDIAQKAYDDTNRD